MCEEILCMYEMRLPKLRALNLKILKMNRLPDDVLKMIFAQLDSEDILEFLWISKRLRQFAESRILSNSDPVFYYIMERNVKILRWLIFGGRKIGYMDLIRICGAEETFIREMWKLMDSQQRPQFKELCLKIKGYYLESSLPEPSLWERFLGFFGKSQ